MTDFGLACPIPLADYPAVTLAHGGGGRLMNHLIERMFMAAFKNPHLDRRHDGAVFETGGGRLAITTDSYVVRPLFFPGGDIGSLAVHGTVNDLAMCGARPLHLTVALILEEGLPMDTLWRVTQSLAEAARACEVSIVAGDTKVVDRGKGDGLYLNTTGIGILEHALDIRPASVRPGDAVLVSGDLGRHGMAVMAVRAGLEFESEIESDSAPLSRVVQALLRRNLEIHCLRDLTRGGLASALNEIAATARVGVTLDEAEVPVREDVRGACEVLGLDPLYVANEGRFVVFLPEREAELALEILRAHEVCREARRVGFVHEDPQPPVTLLTTLGVHRVVDMLSGEQLPRIC